MPGIPKSVKSLKGRKVKSLNGQNATLRPLDSATSNCMFNLKKSKSLEFKILQLAKFSLMSSILVYFT